MSAKIFIPGISDIKDPDEREKKLQLELEDVMNKNIQLQNFKKEDLQEGGKYYKSFIKFKAQFQEKTWNYILYYLTQYILIPDTDSLCNYLNLEETKNVLKKIYKHFRNNQKEDADNLISYLREIFINIIFVGC